MRRRAVRGEEDSDPAAYIVVTLLIGTADDRPLIKEPIHSAEALKAVSQQFGSISSDDLMVFDTSSF